MNENARPGEPERACCLRRSPTAKRGAQVVALCGEDVPTMAVGSCSGAGSLPRSGKSLAVSDDFLGDFHPTTFTGFWISLADQAKEKLGATAAK